MKIFKVHKFTIMMFVIKESFKKIKNMCQSSLLRCSISNFLVGTPMLHQQTDPTTGNFPVFLILFLK